MRGRVSAAHILVGLLLLSVLALAFSAWRFEQNLERVREAEGDNRAWNVSQLEVDYQDFFIALQEARSAARSGIPELIESSDAALRLEFDIFYSRTAAFVATLRELEIAAAFEASVDDLLADRNLLADRIDAMEAGDPDALAEIAELTARMETDVRRLAVAALQALVDAAETGRMTEKNLLRFFLIQSIALLALTLVSAGLALRLVRLLQRQSRDMLRAHALVNKAFEGAQEGVLVCDSEGYILLSNPAAREIFGHGDGEFEGLRMETTIVPRTQLGWYREAIEALLSDSGSGIGPVQVKCLRSDGEEFDALITLRAEDTMDDATRIFVFINDITERLQFEERLRLTAREAEQHAEAKGRFLSTMSHEMRTPLHGVIASLELMRDNRLAADGERLLQTARLCSERALAQIDYALSAIRSEEEGEPPTTFDPRDIVRSIMTEMEPLARAKENAFVLSFEGFEEVETCVGQPKAYARAVFNLVGNAVKFTSGGTVRASVSLKPDDATGHLDLVTVISDDGPGIIREDLDRIFSPFEQSEDTSANAANPGFGLGLSIVNQDVARMRGRIEVESDIGKGALFRFTVPVRAGGRNGTDTGGVSRGGAVTHNADACDNVANKGLALVVDDNHVNSDLVSQMLERIGYRAQRAHSGEEGARLAVECRFDVILMDLRMPGMNGIETTGVIRREGASRNATIVGITAQVDFVGSEEFLRSGMTSVLPKPFGMDELAAHLHHMVSSRSKLPEDCVPGDMSAEDHEPTGLIEQLEEALTLIDRDTGLALAQDVLRGAHSAIAAAEIGGTSVADEAHSAAGAAFMIGFSKLGEALRALEKASLSADDAPASEQVENVKAAAHEAEKALCRLQASETGYGTALAAQG